LSPARRRRAGRVRLLSLPRRLAHPLERLLDVGLRRRVSRVAVRVSRHPLELLPQLFLFARQLLEFTPGRLCRLRPRRQIALLPRQLFLTPRQVANLVERALSSLLLGRALGRGLLFVVRALLPLQLAVEERRQVLRMPVAETAAAVRPLLRDLTPPDVGLRAQQRVQRRHLVRHRVSRLQALQLLRGFTHRLDGLEHGILRGGRPLRRGGHLQEPAEAAPLARRARRALGARPELDLRIGHALDVA
jgi:hypothetical protein